MTPPKVNAEYKENVRQSIIFRAMFEFAKKGFFQTRMDDIVTNRISKGTIYNYFNSKTELYIVVQEELRKRWGQATQMSTVTPMTATDSLVQYIKRIVKTLGEVPVADRRGIFETIGIAINYEDKRIFETIKENVKNYNNITRELIKRGKDAGEFKGEVDEEFLSNVFLSFMQGFQLLSILMEKEYNWDAMGDLVAKWILEEVKK